MQILSKESLMKKEEVHTGHRERLLKLISQAGIENVTEVQAVEYFLTYIFPRGDVNPLAHRLLEQFENFGNIIDAEISDLCSVKGINKKSAQKIKLFASLQNYYTFSKMTDKVCLKNTGVFLDLLESLLRLQNTESLYLFAFDHSFNLIAKRRFNLQEVRSVGMSPFDLFNFVASTKLCYLIVAHNHPGGTAVASKQDHEAAQQISNMLSTLDCTFLDSFVVGKDGIYSETQNSFVRTFSTSENLFEQIN